MVEYGGLGGLYNRREVDNENLFEVAVQRLFGEEMKTNKDLCHRIWSSLSNVEWIHANGDTANFSFRAAGDMIAAIIEKGDYLDWCWNSPSAQVDPIFAEHMLEAGWTVKEIYKCPPP